MQIRNWNANGEYRPSTAAHTYATDLFFRLIKLKDGSVALCVVDFSGNPHPGLYLINFGIDGRIRRYKNVSLTSGLFRMAPLNTIYVRNI